MKKEKLDLDLIKEIFQNREDLFALNKILSVSKKIQNIFEKESEIDILNSLLVVSYIYFNFEDVNKRTNIFNGFTGMLMSLLKTGLYLDSFEIKEINKERIN
jgi:hypothetical protein